MSALMAKDDTIVKQVKAMETNFLAETSGMSEHSMKPSGISNALKKVAIKSGKYDMSTCKCYQGKKLSACFALPIGGRPVCDDIELKMLHGNICHYTFMGKKTSCGSSGKHKGKRAGLPKLPAGKSKGKSKGKNKGKIKGKIKKAVKKVVKNVTPGKGKPHGKKKKKAVKKAKKKAKKCTKAPIIKNVVNGAGGSAQCGADSCGKFVGLAYQNTAAVTNLKDPFPLNDAQCKSKYGAGAHWCTPQEAKAFTKAEFKKMYSFKYPSYLTFSCGKWMPYCGMGKGSGSKGCWYFTCSVGQGWKWAPFADKCQGGRLTCCKGKAVRL